MKSLLLYLMILTSNPPEDVIYDHFDMIEINHVYSRETGQNTLNQVVYWRWEPEGLFPVRYWVKRGEYATDYNRGGFVVVDWRMYFSHNVYPTYNEKTGCYSSVYFDKKSKVLRRITSKGFIETHTLEDPEIKNKEIFHKDYRDLLKEYVVE